MPDLVVTVGEDNSLIVTVTEYDPVSETVDVPAGESLPLLSGSGAPNNSLGVNKQSYLDTEAGTFYTKSGGVWNKIADLATDDWVKKLIPEQRVLVDQLVGEVDKFDFVEHKPYTTRDRVIREATPRSTDWNEYRSANYLGVIQSGEPTAQTDRVIDNWFFHGRLHIPIKFEERDIDGTDVQDWYDTSIEQVIPNNFYIGDFPNDNAATQHATGNNDIYYDYVNKVLKQSSNFVNGRGRLTAPTRHRLLDTEDIEHTLATKDEIPEVPELSGWDSVSVVPEGISDRDFPKSLDIALSNKKIDRDVKAASLSVSGQRAALSADTPIASLNSAGHKGVGLLRFTFSDAVADQIGNNLNADAESVLVALTITYADDTSEIFNVPFLINNPSLAVPASTSGKDPSVLQAPLNAVQNAGVTQLVLPANYTTWKWLNLSTYDHNNQANSRDISSTRILTALIAAQTSARNFLVGGNPGTSNANRWTWTPATRILARATRSPNDQSIIYAELSD